MFVVRDWGSPYQYPFGEDGGSMFLKHRLSTADGQKPELRDVRQRIRSCFSELGCFLMPYPGEKVAATNTFDGRQSDLSRDFRDELMKLARSLLAPDRLLVKMVNGTVITCGNLLKLAEAYNGILKKGELPDPKNIFESTARFDCQAGKETALQLYRTSMNAVCSPGLPHVTTERLADLHNHQKHLALEFFRLSPKIGGDAISAPYLLETTQEIEELYSYFKQLNESNMTTMTGLDIADLVTGAVAAASGTISMMTTLYSSNKIAKVAAVTAAAAQCISQVAKETIAQIKREQKQGVSTEKNEPGQK